MLDKTKSRHLRKKVSDFAIIKPSAGESDQIVIKDNVKILSFLNPLAENTQKRYKEIIRSFFAFFDGHRIGGIEPHHIEYYLSHEFKNKSASQHIDCL